MDRAPEQEKLRAQFATKKLKAELEAAEIDANSETALTRLKSELDQIVANQQNSAENEKVLDISSNAILARRSKESAQQLDFRTNEQKLVLEKLLSETEAACKRFESAKGGLNETLTLMQRDDIATKLAQATNIERYIGGDTTDSAIARILTNFPILADFMQKASSGNSNRLTQQPKSPVGTR